MRIIPHLLFFGLLTLLASSGLRAQKTNEIKVGETTYKQSALTGLRTQTQKKLAGLGEAQEGEDAALAPRRKKLGEQITILDRAIQLLSTLNGYDTEMRTLKGRERTLRGDIERAKAAAAKLAPPRRSEVTEQNRDRLSAEAQQLETKRQKKADEVETLARQIREQAESAGQSATELESTVTRRTELQQRAKDIGEDATKVELKRDLSAEILVLQIREGTLQTREANKTRLTELLQERLTVAQLERDLAREDVALLNDRLAYLNVALERRASDMANEERARAEQVRQEIKDASSDIERSRRRLILMKHELSVFQFEVEAELSRLEGRDASLEARAKNAESRLANIRASFPEGAKFEEWKRSALERKLEQAQLRTADFAQKTERERPRLRDTRDRAVSGRDRLNGLLDVMDEIARSPEQLDEAVALDEDGMAGRWLKAAREQKRGEATIKRPARKLLANRDWEEANEALRERTTLFAAKLTALEEAAVRGLELTDRVEGALESSRTHLESVRFWLREPSLFSRSTFDGAVAEAAALPHRIGDVPASAQTSWQELIDGPPRGSRLAWSLLATLGLGTLLGLIFRWLLRRQALRTPPPPPPSLDEDEEDEARQSAAQEHERKAKRAALRRHFFETLAQFATPVGLVAGLQGFATFVRPDHRLLGLLASVATGLVVWRAVVALEARLLSPDAEGNCLLGCDRDASSTLRRTLGRAIRWG